MEKERKFSYKFSGEIKPGAELKERIEKIDGVLFCEINESESEISYALNEWASEYDALTAIIAILEECGLELEISEED
ncbi:MAG: hypothetical protein J5836_02670, partial [Clostridia bacterium]|nr:hypothetical protein [Clostridia bacterium]